MKDTLSVQIRSAVGTRNTRRVRESGLIPAVLYGHGEENISLSIPKEQVSKLIRHGGRLVELTGEVKDTALVRQVQWDSFGIDVLHLDLNRVSADESVEIVLPIELRGTAAGTKEGGVVEHIKHEVKILCPVVSLPEKLELNINSLKLNQSLTLADLPLPAGAKLLTDPEDIIVHCVTPKAELEEGAVAPVEPGEPEVIGRKKEEEGDEAAEEKK